MIINILRNDTFCMQYWRKTVYIYYVVSMLSLGAPGCLACCSGPSDRPWLIRVHNLPSWPETRRLCVCNPVFISRLRENMVKRGYLRGDARTRGFVNLQEKLHEKLFERATDQAPHGPSQDQSGPHVKTTAYGLAFGIHYILTQLKA